MQADKFISHNHNLFCTLISHTTRTQFDVVFHLPLFLFYLQWLGHCIAWHVGSLHACHKRNSGRSFFSVFVSNFNFSYAASLYTNIFEFLSSNIIITKAIKKKMFLRKLPLKANIRIFIIFLTGTWFYFITHFHVFWFICFFFLLKLKIKSKAHKTCHFI